MRRLGIVAALLLATAGTAHADGLYFTEAFGGTRFDDELGLWQDGGVHIHVGAGYRASRISFEVWMGGDLGTDEDYYAPVSQQEPDPMTYGMDFKYAAPITKKIEIYARASISRMEIDSGMLEGYGGRGLGVGTGAQIKGKAPLLGLLYPPVLIVCAIINKCKKLGPQVTAALYVDQGYDFYRLHRDYNSLGSIDAEARRWTIGFAVGSDF